MPSLVSFSRLFPRCFSSLSHALRKCYHFSVKIIHSFFFFFLKGVCLSSLTFASSYAFSIIILSYLLPVFLPKANLRIVLNFTYSIGTFLGSQKDKLLFLLGMSGVTRAGKEGKAGPGLSYDWLQVCVQDSFLQPSHVSMVSTSL